MHDFVHSLVDDLPSFLTSMCTNSPGLDFS